MNIKNWDQLDSIWKEVLEINLALSENSNRGSYNFWKTPRENYANLIGKKRPNSSWNKINKIEKIDIYGTSIQNLKPIVDFPQIKEFYCGSTKLNNLLGIEQAKGLEKLCVFNTAISNLEPLSALQYLKRLCVSKSMIMDISPLKNLKHLEKLALYNTRVDDLSPLAALTKLTKLNINHTYVSDLTPLYNLLALQELHCYNTQVSHQQIDEFIIKIPNCKVISTYEQPEESYDDFV